MNSAKQIDNVDTIDTTVSELATVHWRLLLEQKIEFKKNLSEMTGTEK